MKKEKTKTWICKCRIGRIMNFLRKIFEWEIPVICMTRRRYRKFKKNYIEVPDCMIDPDNWIIYEGGRKREKNRMKQGK